jgi:hypothetical protein
MKKAGLIIILVSAIFLNSYSQNVDDALRYSQVFYGGTARFMSMGGAFTALGADLSSISLNPAGTGVFRSFEFNVTPQVYYNNTSSLFNGTTSTDYVNRFNLSQAGAVINLVKTDKDLGLVTLNAAYSFNRTNNFSEYYTIGGVSDNSSMADYWVSEANGTFYKDLGGSAGIAYDAWVIDTISGSGASNYATAFSAYGNNTNATYGQTIRRVITNDGYSGEHVISLGGNYSNKLYFGAALGINTIHYTGHYQHIENDVDNVIYDFKNFSYTDHLEAHGTGYAFKAGLIVKPVDFIRFAFAFHSPMGYKIDENFYDNITSEFDNKDRYEASNKAYRYTYKLSTPYRILGGVAVIVKKSFIVSADYEYVDYSNAKFSEASDGYDYYNENESIKQILKSTSNYRIGAEWRITNVYLRGGYSYYGKAFKEGESNENLDYNGFSGGIGMRQQNFYFDLGYTGITSTGQYYMYNDPPYLQPATVKSNKNSFTATMGFKF